MLTDNPSLSVPAPDIDAAAIRRSLEQQLKEREELISDLAPRAAPNIDPVAWATTAATRKVVDRILAALERLDGGTYGRCVRCGDTIVAGRLEVLPYGETCVSCQNDVDKS
ncbi:MULTISPECIES: TraR/DksA family transcriptional regulator [unclassified Microbacterium]|uniref:TraR/DksA family transcriptional regulator n=1 Tax=unclassified Microbacterium TaxID=2609290 RepID=UPI00214BEEB7|nr:MULTISPECIES: TraR/DksA family transcriptional regulator [unclassified Microbacterium]MCR2811003.1 TraR/DksA family transcriptional regulator [Microbacterium sp. zg.B185]WIM19599.1 TraR/DksA family transcriptional regulator [Microbacterium sp. zg-B185]